MSLSPRAGGPDHDRVRWRLRIAYDGSGFHGFAAQEGQRTVAGVLGEAIGRAARTPGPIPLTCAGRTDTGVHATGQVVHVDLPAEAASRLEPSDLARSCNSQLAPAVVVQAVELSPPGFDARRSATSRRYRYLVVNAPVADPLLAPVAWQVADRLDVRSMAGAADALLGEHDFRAFCRRVPGADPDDPIRRRVVDTRWTELSATELSDVPGPGLAPVVGRLLAFEIEANAFCHQMVRSLVGTLVDVGRGRRRPSDVLWILRSADRSEASQPAPPHGLALTAVRYGQGDGRFEPR